MGLSDCAGTIFGIITPSRLERNNPPVWLGSGIIRNNFIVQFTFLLDIRLILSDHGMGNEIADRIGRDQVGVGGVERQHGAEQSEDAGGSRRSRRIAKRFGADLPVCVALISRVGSPARSSFWDCASE